MALATAKCPDLKIPNGTSVSNIWKAREVYEDAEDLQLMADVVTDGALTYTVEITSDFEPTAAGFWVTLQDAGADFAPPVAGKAKKLPTEALSATGIRIKASGNVTADRNWRAAKQYLAGVGFAL